MNILEKLKSILNPPKIRDEKQLKIIDIDKGYHLVLAPAGCGKTDILADRVSKALENGIDINDMICLTFTNRASRGMRSRINKNVKKDTTKLFIGNTHRFCSRFLFENQIVSQSTMLIDEEDQFAIIRSLWGNYLGEEEDEQSVADLDWEERQKLTAMLNLQHLMIQYRLGHEKSVLLYREGEYKNNTREKIYDVYSFKNLCKEAGINISRDSVLSVYDNIEYYAKTNEFSITRELVELLRIAKSYEDYKKRFGIIDFDDLLLLTYDFALKNPTSIKKYKWVQIDEVQDLNPLQFAIIDLFTDKENVTIYLGDEQQAIFSFIGAKLETLEWLKNRCGDNLSHLDICYRSPKYLLDIFNDYANFQLDTNLEFLPKPDKIVDPEPDALRLHLTEDANDIPETITKLIDYYPDGRTAILVNSNKEADKISNSLRIEGVSHFKVSGVDVFSKKEIKFLFSHLNVLHQDINYMSWSRILHTLKLFQKSSEARDFVRFLKYQGMIPSDFLLYENSTYLMEFLKAIEEKEIIVFDTETTGLDIYNDDIVQIAAIKYYKGEIISRFNIIMHTDKEIPQRLGNKINPLIEVYENSMHSRRKEGLSDFLDFSKDCVVLAHNLNYDYNILLNNLKRDYPEFNLNPIFKEKYDTLKIIRLIKPNYRSYKLEDLIRALDLEGINSHLADDDIIATLNLIKYLQRKGKNLLKKIKKLFKIMVN